MNRKLIIDGNAVYELDEKCMLRRRLDTEEAKEEKKRNKKDSHKMKRTE